MFLNFLDELRTAGIPASMKEHLVLLDALNRDVIERVPRSSFYFLSRSGNLREGRRDCIDRFDQVFAKVFKGIADQHMANRLSEIPADWLACSRRKIPDARGNGAKSKSLGSWDEIMETLKQRLEEQKERHEGGNKWIGTGGTSPYGNSGYNPEGVRIGGESKSTSAR